MDSYSEPHATPASTSAEHGPRTGPARCADTADEDVTHNWCAIRADERPAMVLTEDNRWRLLRPSENNAHVRNSEVFGHENAPVSGPDLSPSATIATWMGRLSWSEVRDRAIRFSKEWAGAKSERADKQTFWNEFFRVFGLERKTVAAFEAPVRKLTGNVGAIDLFWRGVLLVEHKSLGADLKKAEGQAFDYVAALAAEGRADEAPRYILVSDFDHIALFDLAPPDSGPLFRGREHVLHFHLSDLHRNIRAFGFMLGLEAVRVDPEDPANKKAFRLMCDLHDELERGGFVGHDLERLLVRILYCLFAEDTGVFAPDAFANFVRGETREDGSDLGARLNEFFEILDTPVSKRQKRIDPELAALPHVNGQLFQEPLRFARFTGEMRKKLISCTGFYWARISPAIFGSLFQGILDTEERRAQGAHYTSERDVLKVIRPLFLDELNAEFDSIRADTTAARAEKLSAFQKRLSKLRLLDPACGCGSFLIIAYRELRVLELEVVVEMLGEGVTPKPDEIPKLFLVNVDQFFGIEQEEWPARIAEVALWLTDHQMNVVVSERVGERLERLPLESAPRILVGNALQMSWDDVLARNRATYVLGNPPFVGKQYRSAQQQQDMEAVWHGVTGHGVLNYVTCWFRKAAEYVHETGARVALVATSTITNGEQVGVLWNDLFKKKLKIHFAHRTFPWTSEARGKAHVHVVIVGFGEAHVSPKRIYDYEVNGPNAGKDAVVSTVSNISPYLIEGGDTVARTRKEALCGVPPMSFGNMPNDGGHLLLTDEERTELLGEAPNVAKFVRPFVGPDEFMHSTRRWCLWLVDADPGEVRKIRPLVARIDLVRKVRSESPRGETNALAKTPMLFGEIRQPQAQYLGVPKTGSERRRYVPVGFFSQDVIASTDLLTIEGAGLYEFGVLSSNMHMAWVRTVGGRFKSDPRYSATLVYNTFPWPDAASEQQRATVQAAAKAVQDARVIFLRPNGTSTMSDLYDPLTMPAALAGAHEKLDRAVEYCYRREAFKNDRQRLEWLMVMYERLTAASAVPQRKTQTLRPVAQVSPKPPKKAGRRTANTREEPASPAVAMRGSKPPPSRQ